jgi:serine protease
MKRSYLSLLKNCAAALVAAGALAGVAQAQQVRPAQSAAFVAQTDRLIVKYKDSVPADKGPARAAPLSAARRALIDRAGQQFGLSMKLLHTIATGAHVLQLDRKMPLPQVVALATELAARDPSVEYAEPDRIMTAQFVPNDPQYGNQWDFYEAAAGIRLPAAWDKSIGTGVNVAVIDTGYRPHADLVGQILPGYDFISSSTVANDGNGRDSDASDPGDWTLAGQCGTGSPPQDEPSSWHGTHVSGTIAAHTNNGLGVAGVAFDAKIVPARVLGRCGGYTSDIADAIIWSSGGTVSGVPANANKARVLNMSLGGAGACDSTSQNAINSARSRGAVVVVAAGNSNTDASNATPANCQGVIAVAAVGRTGGKASYSNFGSVVDIAAPGGDTNAGILSTLNTGTTTPAADTYAYYIGTSMATPHVAGVAALMLSVNPNLTPDDVETMLKANVHAFTAACSGCGAGIVDASAAVAAAVSAPAPTQNEVEPNNTSATANAVGTSGTAVNGTMASSFDNDYFIVQVPAGRTISAMLMIGSSTSDYDLYMLNSAGSQIASSTNGAGSNDAIARTNTSGATSAYYLRVRYRSGATGAAGKYTLRLSW